MLAVARAPLPVCAAAVLRLRDAPAPHPGLHRDSSLCCDARAAAAAPEVALVAEAITRLQAQVVQQQAQLTQMVQLLVVDRLRPRSSSTSNKQRDRCGCTRSAQFLHQGPQLTRCRSRPAAMRWCPAARQWVRGCMRKLCSNRGPQTSTSVGDSLCNPLAVPRRKCREDAIAYYYPQQGNTTTKLRCMLLDEELDAAQVVAAHIYQLHWGPEFAVRRHKQQGLRIVCCLSALSAAYGSQLWAGCQQDLVEV